MQLILTTTINQFWRHSQLWTHSPAQCYPCRCLFTIMQSVWPSNCCLVDSCERWNSRFWLTSFSNDIWSSLSGVPGQRSKTLGFSYIGQICTPNRFSIAEDIGGFANIDVRTRTNLVGLSAVAVESSFMFQLSRLLLKRLERCKKLPLEVA